VVDSSGFSAVGRLWSSVGFYRRSVWNKRRKK
jgi:hypothetical protein